MQSPFTTLRCVKEPKLTRSEQTTRLIWYANCRFIGKRLYYGKDKLTEQYQSVIFFIHNKQRVQIINFFPSISSSVFSDFSFTFFLFPLHLLFSRCSISFSPHPSRLHPLSTSLFLLPPLFVFSAVLCLLYPLFPSLPLSSSPSPLPPFCFFSPSFLCTLSLTFFSFFLSGLHPLFFYMVLVGSPSRGRDVAVYFKDKPTELAHSL